MESIMPAECGRGAMKRLVWLALSLVVTIGFTACQSGFKGEVTANQAPDTRVTATPPALEQTSFTVQFYWTGLDNDGWIDHFEWRISDNGQDGIIDQGDTLGLPWHSTVVTDSTFEVSADIALYQNDVNNPQITDPKDFRYWQTHTFFVRSVDNLGVADAASGDGLLHRHHSLADDHDHSSQVEGEDRLRLFRARSHLRLGGKRSGQRGSRSRSDTLRAGQYP